MMKKPLNTMNTEIKSVMSVAILLILITILNPLFITSYNLSNLFDAVITIFLLGIGLSFVIMSGGIDLSIGSMLSLSAVLFVMLLNSVGMWAYPLILLVGMLEGLLVGLFFVGLKIPSFIASFGMMGVYQSLAIVISHGETVGVKLEAMSSLDAINLHLFGPIKIIHVLVMIILLMFLFIQKRTTFGKYVNAIGNGEMVTWYSGIDVARTKVMTFIFSGLSAALGAIVLCSRMYTGDPTFGIPYLLIVIAAVVVGGTALSGGAGGVFNTFLGALLIAAVQNGMQMLGISVYYQEIVIGIILIIAISMTMDKEKIVIIK